MTCTISLLHDITQAGYEVKFAGDFKGMVRLDFFKEHVAEFYEHNHCGFPGCTREKLEQAIVDSLVWFKNEFSIPDAKEDHELSTEA